MPEIARKRATPPLVLALDIGSSATRGRIFDVSGSSLRKLESRVRHQLTTTADGGVVADADAMLDECVQIVDDLMERGGKRAAEIAGVAMDTFASTLVGVDAKGKALTPVYTYADSRPGQQVTLLQRTRDEHAVQQRTGCRFNASYLPARFLWLAKSEPDTMSKVDSWLSLGEYIYLKLTGQRGSSFSTAAWSGLLNRHTLDWDQELIGELPIKVGQFSPLRDTAEPLEGLRPTYKRRWPGLAKAQWFPAIADGYASNVGSDATTPSVLALSLGSSGAVRALLPSQPEQIPDGLWCYAVNRREALLGGALNDGGRAVAWLRGLLNLPAEADLVAAMKAPPSAGTPVVLPFLTGERSPGWAAHAQASFSRMDLHTTPIGIFRGLLEGIGIRLALIAEEVRGVATVAERVVASGGAIEGLPDWQQILADLIELPVVQSLEGQATLHGTAATALDVLVPDRGRAPAATGETYTPNPDTRDAYRAARLRQQSDYHCLVSS
ncbi:MAG: gluconokinase [Dehalococcoidia bacterium]